MNTGKTGKEIFNHHFEALKTCPPADIPKHSMVLLESFLVWEKNEQDEFSELFYRWAEKHAIEKPLVFCYAGLTRAFSLFYREQYDAAFPMLTEIQNRFLEQGDVNGAAVCQVIQGNIFRTFGNTDLALKSLWSSYEQLKHAELYRHFLMACTITLGGIYLERKHYDEAIPHFRSTLEMAEPGSKYYWMIYALHGLGAAYLQQEKYPDAKECLEQAMLVAEKYNNPVTLCNSLSELGNYYFITGDYAGAERYHRQAFDLREKHHFIGGAVTSCIRLGEVYIKQLKPEEAIAVLEKGLKLADQIKVKPKMFQIHLLLSEIYQGKNEPEKSLFHYKLYHKLHEQVELEDNARKIKNAQLVFEAEQTKKENVIIKRQKTEIERKNVELQETIDELTRARVGKKAKAITLGIAIVLFILEDFVLHFALTVVNSDNYFISLIVKMVIIFSLSPINKAVENYLLKRIIRKKKVEPVVLTDNPVV